MYICFDVGKLAGNCIYSYVVSYASVQAWVGVFMQVCMYGMNVYSHACMIAMVNE